MLFQKTSQEIVWANEVIDRSWAYRAARLVQVASGAGLYARLASGSATAAKAAADLGLDADITEKVLIVSAAMGLAARDGPRWTLTPKGRATLDPAAPCYQGNTLAHGAGVWNFWHDLEPALRGQEGASVFSPEAEAPERSHRDFILAMHNMAMAGRAAELADHVDLAGKRTLLDMGGGPGTYAMALCERYPDLAATVVDLAPTIEIAREVIARLGLQDRVRTQVGDWDQPSYGEGLGAVLLGNIMHGPTSDAEGKLARSYRALAPGGVLIVQEFLMNAEKTGPLTPALFNIMVGAFSAPELVDRIAAAGFKDIRVQALPEIMGTSVVTAVK